MRLLLVEDDETAARGIQWALEDRGIEVHVLNRGEGVADAIAELRPDAVILDVILDDVDGITVWKDIRRRWPDLPVVLASGRDVDFPGVQAAIAGRKTAFLQKPFEMAALISVVEQLMSG